MALVIESVSQTVHRESEAMLMILKLLCSGMGVGVQGDEGMGIIHVSPGIGGHFEASHFT